MKKTKIICTVGPASEDRQILRSMMLNGMNGARLNFSHGTHEGQKRKIDLIKELREELNLPIPIILDTKGPEIRTGRFAEKEVKLTEGQKYILSTEDVLGTSEMCSVSYKGLIEDVKPGNQVLVDDGLVGMTIDEIRGSQIICTVNNSGIIKDYKSVNVPGVSVKLPAITDKDKDDILFGIGEQIDFIAQSFARKSTDIQEMRAFLEESGAEHVKIIAKIENKEGIDNISDIIQDADIIMVARGDLGVEIPAEQVPLIQKKIIKLCNFAGKPVITATQMMDSMIRNPRPTRAEVADVANAIFDGTDVIMLSGETASGRYPEESVRTMNDIAITTEAAINYDKLLGEKSTAKDDSITDAIGYATCTSAQGLKAAAIITPTTTGHTAKVVSKFRPKAPILAFTRYDQVARQLSLVWGVTPLVFGPALTEIDVFREAVNASVKKGFVSDKDLIVITAGAPVGVGGMTNMLRIHIVGNKI
ncbi:MAG: pyruvate kinase [Eubacteriales bacterium]|nr:pyruvate kinase [Eubacteriales bacterium]MDD3198731.1 pyruvate kinase [Eubacteriales bacterium]MDD4122052.1 pyruvate kinase [Eubacteriales bacterium]MDD4629023.1 pyruvate kinase [Eubacteriales bacterium]